MTDLHLDPAELGSLRLSLATTDGSVTLTISAERPETAELIRRHLGELTAELRSLGYQEVNLNFGPGGQTGTGQSPPGAPPHPGAEGTAPHDPDPAAPPPTREKPAPRGTLDLRL